MLFFEHNKVLFVDYNSPIFLILFLLTSVVEGNAQVKKIDWNSKLTFSAAYGHINPTLDGNQSLTITAFPSQQQNETILARQRVVNNNITNSYLFEFETLYQLKPKLNLGLALQFNGPINYQSQLYYSEQKLIPSNNTVLKTTGFYNQNTRITSITAAAVSKFEWFAIKMKTTSIALETGIGLGASFISLRSGISNIELTLKEANSSTTQNDVLNRGDLAPETDRLTTITWQISSGIMIKLKEKPAFKLGFRYVDLGKVTLFKRQETAQDLFTLTSTVTGAQDQNLVLASTNTKRRLFSKAIYIQFYF